MNEAEDLERFLQKVGEIGDLMQELSSSDVNRQKYAVEKADHLLSLWSNEEPCRTQLNRTVINSNLNSSNLNSEGFMKAVEKDAEERSKRRREHEKLANAYRMGGNEAFAKGDYKAAVQQYSAGLEVLRDAETLYTNRAQAFIKLQMYKEAISDCDWALKCNARNIKAYVHKAKAYMALGNYTEARTCYQRIVEIYPNRATMVKEYLTRVDLQEKKDIQEKQAWEELDKGRDVAVCIHEVLRRLDIAAETNQYYLGGVELLRETISDCASQTLFRLHNGFTIINNNNTVRRCLSQNSAASFADELCVSVLRLWTQLCKDNEENQQVLIQCPNSSEYFVDLLRSGKGPIQEACLVLLHLYIQTQHGRHLILENLNMHMLVENLWTSLCHTSSPPNLALGILEHLAVEHRFRIQMRENFTASFIPPFVHLLRNITESSQEWLPQLVSVMGSMATDDVIRKEAACSQEYWDVFLTAMEQCIERKCRDVLYSLLGLMINLSARPSPVVQEFAVVVGRRCVDLLSDPDGGIITRSVGLLSTLLPQSPAAAEEATQAGVVWKLLRLLKAQNVGQITTRFSIKALAVCTASSQQARVQLLDLDKRMRMLRRLLAGSEEVAVGNAALCLGHCVEEFGAASALLGSDIIPLLLRLAGGDAGGPSVQQNAAIALGKLCKAEPRHLLKLRELHGLEILHSCMKLIT